MNLLIFFALTITIVMVGIIKTKRSQARSAQAKEQRELKKRIMPNGGMIPEDNELLDATDEEILEIVKDNPENQNCPNLMHLINYVSYKGMEAPEDVKSLWYDLLSRLTSIKVKTYRHGW